MRTALVVVALVAVALTGCARERYETSYPDLVTARQRDAIERGWIPEFLPEATTDLRELHDPQTRQHVVRGTLAEEDLPEECEEVEVVGTPPLSPSWLPSGAGSVGTPLRCGSWDGTIEDSTLVLWTDRPDERDDDEDEDGTGTATEEGS